MDQTAIETIWAESRKKLESAKKQASIFIFAALLFQVLVVPNYINLNEEVRRTSESIDANQDASSVQSKIIDRLDKAIKELDSVSSTLVHELQAKFQQLQSELGVVSTGYPQQQIQVQSKFYLVDLPEEIKDNYINEKNNQSKISVIAPFIDENIVSPSIEKAEADIKQIAQETCTKIEILLNESNLNAALLTQIRELCSNLRDIEFKPLPDEWWRSIEGKVEASTLLSMHVRDALSDTKQLTDEGLELLYRELVREQDILKTKAEGLSELEASFEGSLKRLTTPYLVVGVNISLLIAHLPLVLGLTYALAIYWVTRAAKDFLIATQVTADSHQTNAWQCYRMMTRGQSKSLQNLSVTALLGALSIAFAYLQTLRYEQASGLIAGNTIFSIAAGSFVYVLAVVGRIYHLRLESSILKDQASH